MSNKYTSVYDWLKYIKANVVGINLRELRLNNDCFKKYSQFFRNFITRADLLRNQCDQTGHNTTKTSHFSYPIYAKNIEK